jgi:hypothetical protein
MEIVTLNVSPTNGLIFFRFKILVHNNRSRFDDGENLVTPRVAPLAFLTVLT